MSEQKQLIRRWFDEVWNGRRRAAVAEFLSPDCVIHGLSQDGLDTVGPEGFTKFHGAFLGAFSNLRISIDDLIEEHDRVVARFTATGTNDGDGLGFPATHQQMRVQGITIVRIQHGKLVEGWNVFDAAGMLQQLGVVPAGDAW